MKIILIVAMAANRVIGNSQINDIPWHLPQEQQRFKQITMGFPMVMGRRTYQSIGRPLPGREMIVVTRNKGFSAPGCLVAATLEEALQYCCKSEKVFIIGGGEIYRQSLSMADKLIVTVLAREVEGDVLFPDFSAEEFSLHDCERFTDPELYEMKTYLRIKK